MNINEILRYEPKIDDIIMHKDGSYHVIISVLKQGSMVVSAMHNMNVSEQFERHFNPERFEGSEPRSARIARAPRRTNSESELVAIERRYRRMGFDKREARFKARMYHTMKL